MSLQMDHLGQATFILTGPTSTHLIADPYLSGNPQTRVPPNPVKPEDVHMDLVVVSHCAGNHFGQTLEILANSDTTKLLGDHNTLYLAERAGYGRTWNPRMELTTSGATCAQDGFTTCTVNARHITFKHLPDSSYITGGPLCYVIRVKDGPTCFFGEDASLTYDMELWGEPFHPDVAFLGIGGVDLQGKSLDEMDPPATAICAKILGIKTVTPMRYRIQEHLEQFQQYPTVHYPECRCLAMKAGESVML